jgi:hypothetical protein
MKRILALSAVSVLALGACGSGSHPESDNYVGVCLDRYGNFVEDWHCDGVPAYSNGSFGSGFGWGYLLASSTFPRYGQRVNNVIYNVDETHYNVYRGGVPSTGGRLNPSTYKPKVSKIVKPDTSVSSSKYKDVYVQQDSTYKRKDESKNNTYKNPSPYKNPAPAPKPVYKAPSKAGR